MPLLPTDRNRHEYATMFQLDGWQVRFQWVEETGRVRLTGLSATAGPGACSVYNLARRLSPLASEHIRARAASLVSLAAQSVSPEVAARATAVLQRYARTGTAGRPRLSPTHLATVADVYRAALEAGRPPVRAVAEELGCSRSTAGHWVVRARREGHL